ncbi:hypothetical protein [Hoeflea ulvae]|uniref:Uncharacterized protein n=1 Tax=Hoeflea ulvae TaxID=2983764 RepID=A0ABT3YEU4_9HYPH|nr:hypothetical protein [Hoeflea ulvae]MCY0094420.1 hypothetical protein [Hoeflea ulvae]
MPGTADVLMFTGVRREPLHSGATRYASGLPAPMFDDPAPLKPTGRKRQRSKNG